MSQEPIHTRYRTMQGPGAVSDQFPGCLRLVQVYRGLGDGAWGLAWEPGILGGLKIVDLGTA